MATADHSFPWQLTVLAFGVGFSGFNLLLLILASFGQRFDSQLYTVPYRILFLVFSVGFLGLILRSHAMTKIKWLWVPLLSFWILYFLQIFFDGYLFETFLGTEPLVYLQRALGGVFIPMFIFLKPLTDKENKFSFIAFWAIHLACLIFALLLYRDFIGHAYRSVYMHGHSEDRAILLGPIGISYIGVLAITVALQRICMESPLIRKWIFNLLHLGIIVLGTVVMLLGETRSAVVSCVSVALIVFFASFWSRSLPTKIKVLFIALAAGLIMFVSLERFGQRTGARFQTLYYQVESADLSLGGGRWGLYQNALSQFMQSPILGSGLEEKVSRTYPHNHFIEAFMATGIVGGISFFILAIAGLYCSYMVLKHDKEKGWIACFFLVFFFRGMFSASIIDGQLWYGLIAVIAVWLSRRDAQTEYLGESTKQGRGSDSFKHKFPKYYY